MNSRSTLRRSISWVGIAGLLAAAAVGIVIAGRLLTTAGLPTSAQQVINLPTEDRWLTPEFEELYRLGSLSGEAWEQFGNIGEVVFDQAGQLYVLDHHVDSIYCGGPGWRIPPRVRGPWRWARGISPRGGIRGHAGRIGGGFRLGVFGLPGIRRERSLRTQDKLGAALGRGRVGRSHAGSGRRRPLCGGGSPDSGPGNGQ